MIQCSDYVCDSCKNDPSYGICKKIKPMTNVKMIKMYALCVNIL